jgi:glycosyltransferase involved in cell wall biosynthesis
VLKLLLVAPTCDGEDVGEAWVAFQWASRLAARHDVTLLTYHKRGRTPVAQQLPGVRVIEWTEPPVLGRAERLNSMLKPAYFPFYIRARRWIRAAQRRGETFDIAHQPVPVAMRYPSPVSGLGIPYLVGPVGGSLETPPGFAADDTAPWYVALRGLDRLRLLHDPLLRHTYERAACVIGIAPYVADTLAGLSVSRFEVMSDTGIDSLPPAMERVARNDPSRPVRLLFVGRLIRTKGARDAIGALGLLRHLPVVLDIVGDGFDRAACEALVAELGIGDRVVFHGAQPHSAVDDFYRAADVFVFPSYREAGGTVVFEAMAASLPLIVSDIGGPGSSVDDSCGFRLHPESPEQYARALADAIEKLVTDEPRRLAMGASSRVRVAAIALWDSKLDAVDSLYNELLSPAADRQS